MATPSSIPWGTITLILDNEAFRQGFLAACHWYFEDIYGEDGRQPEELQRAISLTSEEVLRLIMMPDQQGCYHFDEMGNENLTEYLGYLVGAPSRLSWATRSGARPEQASTTRISL